MNAQVEGSRHARKSPRRLSTQAPEFLIDFGSVRKSRDRELRHCIQWPAIRRARRDLVSIQGGTNDRSFEAVIRSPMKRNIRSDWNRCSRVY